MTDLHQPFTEVQGPIPHDGEDGLGLLARMVEAEIHPGGWDQDAIFGILWRRELGSVLWRTQAVPPVYFINPVNGLSTMAEVMESREARAGSAVLITEDFLGWAAVVEGWMVDLDLTTATVEQLASGDLARQHRTIRLHPDRVETRTFYGATVDGRFTVLLRKRDHEPELITDQDDIAYLGSVPDALRRLAEAGRVALQARHS